MGLIAKRLTPRCTAAAIDRTSAPQMTVVAAVAEQPCVATDPCWITCPFLQPCESCRSVQSVQVGGAAGVRGGRGLRPRAQRARPGPHGSKDIWVSGLDLTALQLAVAVGYKRRGVLDGAGRQKVGG